MSESRAGGGVRYLHRLQVWPVLEAEGIAQLAPGHELVEELAGAVAAVAVQVPGNLEGGDHAKVVVRCRQPKPAPKSVQCMLLADWHSTTKLKA